MVLEWSVIASKLLDRVVLSTVRIAIALAAVALVGVVYNFCGEWTFNHRVKTGRWQDGGITSLIDTHPRVDGYEKRNRQG